MNIKEEIARHESAITHLEAIIYFKKKTARYMQDFNTFKKAGMPVSKWYRHQAVISKMAYMRLIKSYTAAGN